MRIEMLPDTGRMNISRRVIENSADIHILITSLLRDQGIQSDQDIIIVSVGYIQIPLLDVQATKVKHNGIRSGRTIVVRI